MILVLAILVGLAVGLLSRGTLIGLARLEIQGWPLLVAGVALQAYAVGQLATEAVAGVPVRQAVFVVTHALILAVALANLGLPGLRLVSLGAAANLLALLMNNGLMPVTAEARVMAGHQAALDSLATGTVVLGGKGIVLTPEQANVWPLTDILVLPKPLPITSVFSIGDLLVAIGLGYLVAKTMQHIPGEQPLNQA